ncbi:hypothetical protein [Salinarchaeum laminariae]|uniref:hypothetical protein n=1 Tax=Salinarchaeum laminariae TaxID=869888 RepID=UPI0020C09037|nr:hypothetical protein [Salinarchaeum laminariae]
MSGAGDSPDAETETGTDLDAGVDGDADAGDEADPFADVPEWEDEYVNEVAGRLLHNYDLEQDRTVHGESFDLYGEMELHSQKHVLHPSISFAHHESHEHLFLRRVSSATVAEIDRLLELGHDLADEWIDPDPEHYSTDFTFVLVAPKIPEDVRETIAGTDERTLLKYGYNGHYDVHVAVVAPDREALVASDEADVREALTLWEPIENEERGLLGLISRRLQI